LPGVSFGLAAQRVSRPRGEQEVWMMNASCCRRSCARPAIGLLLIACALLCQPALAFGTLTQQQLGGLLQVVEKKGSRATVPPVVAAMLKFEPPQLSPSIKQAVFVDEEGTKHGFAPLNDGSGFFMFRSAPSFGQSVYHVDSNLQLVKAAHSFERDRMVALPDDQGQKELTEELARWSRVLSPAGPVTKPPIFKDPPPASAKP
jgi:hypothetical protein